MIPAKILISMSIPYLIIYYKNQYPYNIKISSLFIHLSGLSVDLVGLIKKKKKKKKKNENVFNCGGEIDRKKFRIFPRYSENRKRTQFPEKIGMIPIKLK